MMISDSKEVRSYFPKATQKPVDVVAYQLAALQQGDGQVFWRFLSPEAKLATGVVRPYRTEVRARPDYKSLPLYRPLIGSKDYEVVGALGISQKKYQVRARVWPAGLKPITYIFRVRLQPKVWPACYEDNMKQAGLSEGPPHGGCWLVDDVVRDDERRDDDGELDPAAGGGPGRALALPRTPCLV
jgi:hypothetical protein